MRIVFCTAFVVSSMVLSSSGNASTSEHFQLSTKDGLAALSGQIDLPENSQNKHPLVIMVPGTGLFDRDAEFGNTGTGNDLIFKKISEDLTQAGFAVLRYDYRGVSCNSQTMPPCKDCTDRASRMSAMLEACIDNSIRASVTPENIRDDIELLFEHAKQHPKIQYEQIIAFGHSEGSLNLSRLIAEKRIRPRGVVFMGGLIESPKSVIYWQAVGRSVESIFEMDLNDDGILHNWEIEEAHSSSPLKQIPIDQLLSPVGHWTKKSLHTSKSSEYVAVRDEAISQDDDKPWGIGKVIQASYRWWKMWFKDDQPVAESLFAYSGRVVYIHGSTDYQVNYQRQKELLGILENEFLISPKLVLLDGVGHSLGSDPIVGPIRKSSIKVIVESIRTVAR